jgi:serpin B
MISMKRPPLVMLLGLALTAAARTASSDGGSAAPRILNPIVPAADESALVAGNTAFAVDLYEQIRAGKTNVFCSPFSISEALAMTSAGARGDTLAGMASALHFTLPQDRLHPAFDALDLALASRSAGASVPGFQLITASALWGQAGYPFEPAFLDTLAQSYGTGMQVVDFLHGSGQAVDLINQWVSGRTSGKIPSILDPSAVTPDTRMVLTSAVYFRAAWSYPFDAHQTRPADFTRADGSGIQVPTMFQDRQLRYATGPNLQAVELPYSGAALSMLLVLPDQGMLSTVESSLAGDTFASIVSALTTYDVDLSLPRFGFDSSFKLGDALTALGMGTALTPAADFSGISAMGGLYLGAVVHRAFVSVDEAGTEAAAATASVVAHHAYHHFDHVRSVTLHFDRPFLFAIRDDATGTIIFLGRVEDPLAP